MNNDFFGKTTVADKFSWIDGFSQFVEERLYSTAPNLFESQWEIDRLHEQIVYWIFEIEKLVVMNHKKPRPFVYLLLPHQTVEDRFLQKKVRAFITIFNKYKFEHKINRENGTLVHMKISPVE